MHRRALLAVAAGSLASVAGCAGSSNDDPGDGTQSPSPTADAVDSSPTPDRSLDVDIEPVNYTVRTREVSAKAGIDPADVVPGDEIPPELRDALAEARDGGYETDDVSETLLAGVDEFRRYHRTHIAPYVRIDGTPYEFEARVPTFVARLADEDVDEYDPDRVIDDDEYDFESDAVREFVLALRARGTHVVREEYRTSVVPEDVEAVLEEYDYVEDHLGVSRIVTERRHADPPYEFDVRELTEEDLWGRPVVDGDDLDPKVEEFFRTAIASDQRAPATIAPEQSEYFTDDVPEAALEEVRAGERSYYRIDGSVYGVIVSRPSVEDGPVTVSIDRPPAEDLDDREFRMRVTVSTEDTDAAVDADRPVHLMSRGALPSVLWIRHDGRRYLLDSEDYDRHRWRDAPDAPDFDRRPANEVTRYLEVGRSVAATYEVPSELPAGTYESLGYFGVSWSDPTTDEPGRASAFYPFRLRITVAPP